MDHLRYFGNWIDGADRIGCIAQRHHFGFIIQQGSQVIQVQPAVLRPKISPFDDDALLF
jgi:hypothetical protein